MCDKKWPPFQIICQITIRGLAVCLAIFFVGCKHHNAINFVTTTQFGVKVGVNAEKIPEMQIGYNRQEAARVPVYLMTSDDKLSASPPTISSILAQARDALNDALVNSSNISSRETAKQLIETAAAMDSGNDEKGSSLLASIKQKAAKLDATGAGAPTRVDILTIIRLIQAEMDKPQYFAEFHEKAKFIATKGGGGVTDAYSTLGTFRGKSTVSGQGELQVAQFFATGIAAQILAEEGGAATVNPNVQPPGNANLASDLQLNEERLSEVAEWIAKGSDPDEQKSNLSAVLKGVLDSRDESDRLYKVDIKPYDNDSDNKTADAIEEFLNYHYRADKGKVQIIFQNYKKIK